MTYVRLMVGGLALAALFSAGSIAAQDESAVRLEGRVTYVSPWEMLVEIDNGPVVMLDVARIPQGQLSQISRDEYVVVTGFIRRPSHKVFATDIRRGTPWIPTVPRWAPQTP